MKTFLEIVAHDLYTKTGNNLSRMLIVFPNKRAGLFFNEYLTNESDKPIWAPAYASISELFQQLSSLKPGDPIHLICKLYKIFCEETQSKESLDEFYFWGELLIEDFDDVDKNLVDAGKLFANLQNLKNIGNDYNFLSKEQEEAIRLFFNNFSIERHTELKEKFISLWNKLGTIYHHYRERLILSGIGYEGMLCRNAIERLDVSTLEYDTYVFVGFNMLNKATNRLFSILQDAQKALFYWDYDLYYTQKREKHEAATFINQNLKQFPSPLPSELFSSYQAPKKICFFSSPTENAQAYYLPEWLQSTVSENERDNAVVLCNETLLPSVLHSIPPIIGDVNITMGFPLTQTPIYNYIKLLIELQTTGYQANSKRYLYSLVQPVLKHPYTRSLSPQAESVNQTLTEKNRFYPTLTELKQDEFLSLIFTPHDNARELCFYLTEILKDIATLYQKKEEINNASTQLYQEALFKSYTTVNRLLSLIENDNLQIQTSTFKSLLNKILSASGIPFHGEPAIGLQIMGVLETRNLDFKNLIIMSLNEGQLPKSGKDVSFIPYNLRKAFGMTTVDQRNAIYAYHFYRLIQRAENITLLYNTSSDGLNRGEWSRYLLQLLIDQTHPISRQYLEAFQSPQVRKEIYIEKIPQILSILKDKYDSRKHPKAIFSPSTLNTYLDCRMKFYYNYVARLRTPNEVSLEIDSATFGSIFHQSAELIYKDLTARNSLIKKEDLEKLLHNKVKIQTYVDTAFKQLFFQISPEEKPEYNGIQLINSKVIASYLSQLLRNDLQYAPFELIAMEQTVEETITLEAADGIEIKTGGIIDRIDSKNGFLRIVDYKTGGSPKTPVNIEQLFTPAEDRPNYIFQTFLYAAIMSRKQKLKVAPALLYIHRAASETYSPVIEMGETRKPKIPVDNFSLYENEFRERLQLLLEEIYNSQEPFTQTEHTTKCQYCNFKAICRR
ncbi:ATP-dependent helicase/deoxyribonuclease subunit B [termite gut metagenome]|uniref:ATP-dependent helicase/deoxyribonuclease subunit B n=1 Tax=termite gut metagenome TaxID=433724 RepID=A0A5J4SBZ5_9ZZZZ